MATETFFSGGGASAKLFRFGGGKRRHSLDIYAAFKSAIACSRRAQDTEKIRGHRASSLDIPKRPGGDENRVGSSLFKLVPYAIMEMPSYIRLLVLMILRNVFPSELIGQNVQLMVPRNSCHRQSGYQ